MFRASSLVAGLGEVSPSLRGSFVDLAKGLKIRSTPDFLSNINFHYIQTSYIRSLVLDLHLSIPSDHSLPRILAYQQNNRQQTTLTLHIISTYSRKMQFTTLLPFALLALVRAQDATTTDDSENPSNALTTLTNSDGVITGQLTAVTTQPTVVTTQPSVITSQASAEIIPAGFTSGLITITEGNSTFTYTADSSTTLLVTPTPTSSGSGASATGASASGSAGSSKSSGAAAAGHIKAGVGALAAAGGFFAIFL